MKKVVLSLILTLSILLSGSQVFAEMAFDYEPNNSPEDAFVINGDSTIMSTISDSNDIDYYKFYVNGTVDTNISLTSPKGLDYDIKLYDADFNEIASSELPAGNTDVINKQSLNTGMYSIKVYCFSNKFSTSAYTLSLKSTYAKGTNMLGYKGMPESDIKNTTLENALEVNNNTLFRAKVSSLNESRYYKFVFDKPSDVDISMTPPVAVDLDMKLYNSSGLEAGSSTNKNGEERITKSNLLPGTFYLKVYGDNYTFSSDTYEIKIKSSRAGLEQIDAPAGNSSDKSGGSVINDPKVNGSMPQALLLYVGPGLPKYSDKDIKKMLIDDPINTKEFVITDNGTEYNTYLNSAGSLTDIVTPEKINALTIDKIDSTGILDSIKSDYMTFYKNADKKDSLDYFSDEAVDLALRLIKTDPNVKLYISIPGVKFHDLSYEYIEPVKEKLMKGIKQKLDKVNPTYWEKNIEGYYFSTEGIPYYYSWFKPDKTIDFNNPVVKTMSSLSNEVHQVYNKKFIWIPFYGSSLGMDEYYNKNPFVRIGYIANRTDIFDYVIIQPTYYFYSDIKNIPFIKASVDNNIVLDTDQSIIGGIKCSNTIIGPEMEIDGKYAPVPGKEADAKAYKERYQEYVQAFSGAKQKYPVAFYAGSRDDLFKDEVYNAVKSFFKGANN